MPLTKTCILSIWDTLVIFKLPLSSYSIFIVVVYQKMETIKSKNPLNILKLPMYITGAVGFVELPPLWTQKWSKIITFD